MKKKNTLILILAITLTGVVILCLVFMFLPKDVKDNLKGNVNIVESLSSKNQSDIDNTIKQDLISKRYNLDNAKVYINPYKISPLTALIVFNTDKDEEVTVTVKGKNSNDIVTKYNKAKEHYIPVVGLYDDYNNNVEIKLSSGKTKNISIKIDKIENKFPTTVNSKDENLLNSNELYFISSPLSMSSFALDYYGDLRWILDDHLFHDITKLNNGHILIGTDDFDEYGMTNKIYEMDYLGRIYNEYHLDHGFLNNIYVKDDGNIMVSSKHPDRTSYSDIIEEIDKTTGKVVKTFDVYKLLKEIDNNQLPDNLSDNYFYNSGIEYDKDSNSLLLTYWGGEFVINLDYENGEIKWILADPSVFTNKFEPYLLKGENGFKYPKGMHSASLKGNKLTVFDNGYNTNKEEFDTKKLIGSYSSANTYLIDGQNIKLEKSIDEDKKYFSYALGDYKNINNRDLILFGRELIDLDYNKGVNINEYDLIQSKILEKANDKVVLDMTIELGTGTLDKEDMSKNIGFSFDSLRSYTTITPTKKETVSDEILKEIESTDLKVEYNFGFDKGFIETDVYYMNKDEANLYLINDKKEGTKYILKKKDKERKETIVTDLPNGKYYVFIEENGKVYKTDKFIEIK